MTSRPVRPPDQMIPVAGPWITEHEVDAVARATATAWYEGASGPAAEFEARFAAYVGRRFAVALPSCTSALHLVLAGLGIGADDEVVVPDATWIATSAPISYVGARPRFADVDPRTWCLTVEALNAVLTERTRAVIAVDLYGGTPDFDELQRACAERGVALIEDAAEAVGSERGGRRAGGFGIASTFSFHGSKTLTTGEGGMVVTDDPELHQRILVLRDHGRRPGDVHFNNDEVAYKYKMSALQAALGGAQLDRVDELVAKKRTVFEWYQARLGETDGITLNHEPAGTVNSYWMTTAILDPALGVTEHELAATLRAQGIDTRPFFHALSTLPAYAALPGVELDREANVVARRLGTYGINLPSALALEEGDVAAVCDAVIKALD